MSKVLNVKTSDSSGHSVTYNIDNPKEIPTEITRNKIVAAFQYGIDNNIIVSSYGDPINQIEQVAITNSEKVIISGEPVYITPDSITANLTSMGSITTTVSVSNAQVQAATFIADETTTYSNFDVTPEIRTVDQDNTNINVTFTKIQSTAGTYTGNLRIVIQGKNFNVPITMTV